MAGFSGAIFRNHSSKYLLVMRTLFHLKSLCISYLEDMGSELFTHKLPLKLYYLSFFNLKIMQQLTNTFKDVLLDKKRMWSPINSKLELPQLLVLLHCIYRWPSWDQKRLEPSSNQDSDSHKSKITINCFIKIKTNCMMRTFGQNNNQV